MSSSSEKLQVGSEKLQLSLIKGSLTKMSLKPTEISLKPFFSDENPLLCFFSLLRLLLCCCSRPAHCVLFFSGEYRTKGLKIACVWWSSLFSEVMVFLQDAALDPPAVTKGSCGHSSSRDDVIHDPGSDQLRNVPLFLREFLNPHPKVKDKRVLTLLWNVSNVVQLLSRCAEEEGETAREGGWEREAEFQKHTAQQKGKGDGKQRTEAVWVSLHWQVVGKTFPQEGWGEGGARGWESEGEEEAGEIKRDKVKQRKVQEELEVNIDWYYCIILIWLRIEVHCEIWFTCSGMDGWILGFTV